MNSVHLRARAAVFAALVTAGAWLALLSCSSDPSSSLGSDSDLLGSEPGTVYQDTIGVLADTVYAFDTPVAGDTDLEVGNDSLYTHTIILQPGFSNLQSGDVSRTVESAALHFTTTNVTGNFPVHFLGLGAGHTYTEGNAVSGLDTLTDADAILDPVANSIDRHLEKATPLYPIPALLAQDWIRDSTKREAIAVVYTDNVNYRVSTIPAKEAGDGHPYLQVNYVGGIQRAYDITHDATAFRPNFTTSNLIVSDGYARRIYFRAQLDALKKDSAVHTATIRFHIVPGSIKGANTSLILYIPDNTDPTKADFKTGQRITEQPVEDTDTVLEFPMTNAIFLILQKKLKDNGFAVRFANENLELRQIELYGTDAPDSLRPQVFVTSSTPADFH
ncbi:MAG TPA: hypothetical protein VFH33_06990 [Candidatus Krumholzibacteria bacterium]|nr:hypothetical protein [Candidatus Krumholzibacteria bacterium]